MFETSPTQVPHTFGNRPFFPKVCGTNVGLVWYLSQISNNEGSNDSSIKLIFKY